MAVTVLQAVDKRTALLMARWVHGLCEPALFHKDFTSPRTQAPQGNMTKFLNRLLGAHVEMQCKIFSLFCSLLVRSCLHCSLRHPMWL